MRLINDQTYKWPELSKEIQDCPDKISNHGSSNRVPIFNQLITQCCLKSTLVAKGCVATNTGSTFFPPWTPCTSLISKPMVYVKFFQSLHPCPAISWFASTWFKTKTFSNLAVSDYIFHSVLFLKIQCFSVKYPQSQLIGWFHFACSKNVTRDFLLRVVWIR